MAGLQQDMRRSSVVDRHLMPLNQLEGKLWLIFGREHDRPLALDRDVGDDGYPKGMEEGRSEEHTSELQSRLHLVCRLLLEKKPRTSRLLHHLLRRSTAPVRPLPHRFA